RKTGLGKYFGPEDLERLKPNYLSDLMSRAPGIRIDYDNRGRRTLVGSRGGIGQGCVNIFVDRVPWHLFEPGDVDTDLPMSNIAAVEAYAGIGVPAEFVVPLSSCATVVVWTRTAVEGR